jgi:hypothetical protein
VPKKCTHFKKEKKCITIVIVNTNTPITKDEYKSRLTSAIARGAQSGYRQRLDTSDYGELLLERRCILSCFVQRHVSVAEAAGARR